MVASAVIKPAGFDKLAIVINHRHRIVRGQRDDLISPVNEERIVGDEESFCARTYAVGLQAF